MSQKLSRKWLGSGKTLPLCFPPIFAPECHAAGWLVGNTAATVIIGLPGAWAPGVPGRSRTAAPLCQAWGGRRVLPPGQRPVSCWPGPPRPPDPAQCLHVDTPTHVCWGTPPCETRVPRTESRTRHRSSGTSVGGRRRPLCPCGHTQLGDHRRSGQLVSVLGTAGPGEQPRSQDAAPKFSPRSLGGHRRGVHLPPHGSGPREVPGGSGTVRAHTRCPGDGVHAEPHVGPAWPTPPLTRWSRAQGRCGHAWCDTTCS